VDGAGAAGRGRHELHGRGDPQARGLGRCATIVVIHPDTPLPSAEVRGAVQVEMRKLDPFVVCGATVLGRDDLTGTALRAVASTLQLLNRPTHPERIVGTGQEAVAFVHGLLAKHGKPGEGAPSQDELLVAYEQVIRQVWQTR
jgi:hypothetical protein